MTRSRVVAALAAMLTALLLQTTLIAALTMPVPVSLPAVTVAAIALVDGPGAGISYGFVAGLIADLASVHPAGVLALGWLGVGLACGLAANRVSLRRDVAVAALVCALVSGAVTLLLSMLPTDGATAGRVISDFVPTLLGDAALALVLVPIVRVFLRSGSLRSPHTTQAALLVRADR